MKARHLGPRKSLKFGALCLALALLAAGCAAPAPATNHGHAQTRSPAQAPAAGQQRPSYSEAGLASWYGKPYHGRQTASGRIYNMFELTAAHRTLPFGTRVKVTNLENGRSVVLTITDRGPFVGGRVIDVSLRAAQQLKFQHKGIARVRVETIGLTGV
jgi:rare lipoprotein A